MMLEHSYESFPKSEARIEGAIMAFGDIFVWLVVWGDDVMTRLWKTLVGGGAGRVLFFLILSAVPPRRSGLPLGKGEGLTI